MDILKNVLPEGAEAITIEGISLDDDRLISEGEAAVERFKRSREQILPMARGLLAAKRKYPAKREFGAWLRGSPYWAIDDHDRAALIKIGEQLDEHEEVVVEFLTRTRFVSPQLIWIDFKKKLQPQPTLAASNCDDRNSADDPTDADTSAAEDVDAEPDADPPPVETVGPSASAKPHELYGTEKRFDLVVLTPGKNDLARLQDASLEELRECFPVRKHVEDAAAVVIAATITDLPVVIGRLLSLCGFNRPKRILLRHQPTSPDVVNSKVLVTAERGDIAFREPPEIWLDGADDPIDVAEELYEASSTLQLFATAKAKKEDSNCVVVGNDSWKKLPRV
jgi:hypothetical protein